LSAIRQGAFGRWSEYSWSMEQARHLRAGRWHALDRENLSEEIESLGREQFNKLESALPVLMLHMLKWDHQPDRCGRDATNLRRLTMLCACCRMRRVDGFDRACDRRP
jgi:hypothetical protein